MPEANLKVLVKKMGGLEKLIQDFNPVSTSVTEAAPAGVSLQQWFTNWFLRVQQWR